ncbi:unnamed protein product [Cyprideis torosa]|uniref:Uncharacterized protein n=1 Tax=Cyprideis torosa TaxID=163714 RepID=A0A7R8WJ53_9CRUS|nr:unnamed protein product [Cyprideis torosa]CAG0898747.1 unnamed protein product [Cyprideis torosa]
MQDPTRRGFRCPYCRFFVAIPSELINHQKVKHPAEKLAVGYWCDADSKWRVQKFPMLASDPTKEVMDISGLPPTLKLQFRRIAAVVDEDAGPSTYSEEPSQEDVAFVPEEPDPSSPTGSNKEAFQEMHTGNEPITEKILRAMDKLPILQRNKLLKFFDLLAGDKYPHDNISFLLWLDTVEFFAQDSTCGMRYDFPETRKFWSIGKSILKGKFLRFMSGPKSKGHVSRCEEDLGSYDPGKAEILFAVPKTIDAPSLSPILPGICTNVMTDVAAYNPFASYKIAFDEKKIRSGNDEMGDEDMWGHEVPSVQKRKRTFEAKKSLISDIKSDVITLNDGDLLDADDDTNVALRKLLRELANTTREIREAKTKCERQLSTRIKSAGPNWKQHRLAKSIMNLKLKLQDLNADIQKGITVSDRVMAAIAYVNKSRFPYYVSGGMICVESLDNFRNLEKAKSQDPENQNSTRYVQQRTPPWHQARKSSKVTGSSLYAALGLEKLKKMQQHFNVHVLGSSPQPFPAGVQQRLDYGVSHEMDAVATLVGKILPALYPNSIFSEEGFILLPSEDGQDGNFFLSSPDGSIHSEGRPLFAVEIKTKFPTDLVASVYYDMQERYVLQVLAEMAVLTVKNALFLVWSENSTVLLEATFDESLWKEAWDRMNALYARNPEKPKLHLDTWNESKNTSPAEMIAEILGNETVLIRKDMFPVSISKKSSTVTWNSDSYICADGDIEAMIKAINFEGTKEDFKASCMSPDECGKRFTTAQIKECLRLIEGHVKAKNAFFRLSAKKDLLVQQLRRALGHAVDSSLLVRSEEASGEVRDFSLLEGQPLAELTEADLRKLPKQVLRALFCEVRWEDIEKDWRERQPFQFVLEDLPEVENTMLKNLDFEEAKFCRLVREWYLAEDEPGIRMFQRTKQRLAMRDWLLSCRKDNFASFPPRNAQWATTGLSKVLWEGMLTNMERSLQVLPFVAGNSINSRAMGTLETENFFSSIQDLDPLGTGVLTPKDIPTVMRTVQELDKFRLDPNKPFPIRTRSKEVYHHQELSEEEGQDRRRFLATKPEEGVVIIKLRDHYIFDHPNRAKRKPQRKSANISDIQAPSRGSLAGNHRSLQQQCGRMALCGVSGRAGNQTNRPRPSSAESAGEVHCSFHPIRQIYHAPELEDFAFNFCIHHMTKITQTEAFSGMEKDIIVAFVVKVMKRKELGADRYLENIPRKGTKTGALLLIVQMV